MKQVLPYRILVLLALFLGCLYAGEKQLFYHLDHTIAEKRMELHTRPVTGQIALLEIDNKSLTTIGLWPWKRSIYGDIVKKAFAAGAEELAFDIDFSSSSSPEEDLAFQKALEDAEGPVTLAIFQQNDISDRANAKLTTNRPIAQLEENAWMATVNVLADQDGVIRHFPFAQEVDGEFMPSLTSVMGGVQDIIPGTFIVDYGISAQSIPTFSVIDLLQGKLPTDALKGKKVLVGAGAAELRDTMAVPIVGMMSGPKLQILAAENLLQHRNLSYLESHWTYLVAALLLVPIFFVGLTKRISSYVKIIGLGVLAIAIEIAGFWLYSKHPLIFQTAMLQTQLALSGAALVLFEIRFKDILLTLSHRRSESIADLLETIVEDSFSGIIIVNESGKIVEISHQAQNMLDKLGFEANQNDQYTDACPTKIVDLFTTCLKYPETFASRDSLNLLEIQHEDETRYYEYSITPSQILSDHEMDEATRVATLLFHDVTEAKREKLRLEYLADHDPQTDLFNKTGFNETTDERMIAMLEQDALIFACQGRRTDKITQSLGVEYADLLMRQIAERLSMLEGFQIVGSSEQKEFLLCKLGATKDEIRDLSKSIQQCFENPFSVRGHNIILGCHIGVADFRQGGLLSEEVTKAAIVALHRSKETGDNHLFYTSDLAADVVHRRVLEREIIDALGRDEFELYYQPQIDLKSNRTIGCEALIRWKHRDLGHIRPDLFIPIVEETGLIVDLGRWILEQACTDAMRWPQDITVAVNISAIQFSRSDILADIRNALKISGLPKERLHIEITESLFIADPETIIASLNAIRAEGIKIALDDFGTGYSSLSYIHQFPLDKIKIDRAFVKDLPHSMDSMAVINAVTALAHGFDMDIVAEGMETKAQADALRVAGCHIGQGFFFGKPMPFEEFGIRLSNEAYDETDHQTSMAC